MKISRYLLVLVLCIFLPSCPKRQQLVNETGVYRSPQGNWKVELLNEAPGLRVTHLKRRPGPNKGAGPKGKKEGETLSPENWQSSPGAFVYFDDADRVWCFDGKDRTFIVEEAPEGLLAWNLNNFPGEVPLTFKQMIVGAQGM